MAMLHRRSSDLKVAVRKAAIQAIESLAPLRSGGLLFEVRLELGCSVVLTLFKL